MTTAKHAEAQPVLEREAPLLDSILDRTDKAKPAAPMPTVGMVFGQLVGFNKLGVPLVDVVDLGLTACEAVTTVELSEQDVGRKVVIGLAGLQAVQPVVLGMLEPVLRSNTPEPGTMDLVVDGRAVTIEAEREIELRCGDAAIILSADGRITLRGTYITSHASATQRILGGSVNVN